MDGSGRMTIRNRKYLRKYIPVMNSAPTITINRDFNYQKLNKTRTTQPPLLDEGEPLPPAPLPTPLTEDFMPAQVPVELMAPPPLGETTQTQPMVLNLETPPIISDQKTPPLLPDPDGIPSISSTPPVKDQTRHPSSPVRPVPLCRSAGNGNHQNAIGIMTTKWQYNYHQTSKQNCINYISVFYSLGIKDLGGGRQ